MKSVNFSSTLLVCKHHLGNQSHALNILHFTLLHYITFSVHYIGGLKIYLFKSTYLTLGANVIDFEIFKTVIVIIF